MTNEKQQTAVEWLENNIQSDMTFMDVLGLIRQAKEMEKEQIINAYTSNSMIRTNSKAEQYYNETYGGNK
jgi:hypothetical protein